MKHDSTHRPQGLLRDTRGAGFTEYVILVGLVAILGYAMVSNFGGAISKFFQGATQTVGGISPK